MLAMAVKEHNVGLVHSLMEIKVNNKNNGLFACRITKTLISCADPKFQASILLLLLLYRMVYVGPGFLLSLLISKKGKFIR